MTRNISRLAAIAGVAALTACTTDNVVSPSRLQDEGSITVIATSAWQFVSLADSALVTPTPSPNASTAWDIAFLGTNVTLNGGDAGPGGVTAACLCQNASATNDQVLAMTAESEFADFDTVTAVPPGLSFVSDALTPAIVGWHAGSGAAATADTTKTWLLRLSDSTSFAALRVKAIATPTATHAGSVTLEYRLQTTSGSALPAPQQIVINAGATGGARVDLNTGTITTDDAAWDLHVQGFTIRVNGGISGSGKAGAATTATAFADLTTAVTNASAYRIDTYAGVFGSQRYYRYNILGDHRISPTFDVYFLRRGSDTYKLQVTGYYSATGAARHITFRWAKLD
ncbi:HmuY family protein [Pseudogemmatithrix spongiicola]|uniref:HmuY family protein n=1 Tax=Pseudogemmatithrix spongiicola TaxID=3062599 RepID=A0AA49JX32_9BACT|nr:HmuY family protein [Gemmatimonadaceae bacterium 'strain 138']WKW16304.1 HmuY family protein [Gemmatimonadaceae bacterium 'strain 318']